MKSKEKKLKADLPYVKKIIADFKRNYAIPDGVVDPRKIINKLGIVAWFKPFNKNISGMAFINGDNKYILINTNCTVGHQNFTILHEIFHLFYDDKFDGEAYQGPFVNQTDLVEVNADAFAAGLLMPDEIINNFIPLEEIKAKKISLNTLLELGQYLQCSRAALIVRFEELGIIEIGAREKHYLEFVLRNAANNGFDTKLYKADKTNYILGPYLKLANELLENQFISLNKYFQIMNVVENDIFSNEENLEDEI